MRMCDTHKNTRVRTHYVSLPPSNRATDSLTTPTARVNSAGDSTYAYMYYINTRGVTLPFLYAVQQANMYASELQDNICLRFKDNGCMNQLANYESLCAGAQQNGAQRVAVLSAGLVIVTGLSLLINTLI